MDGVQRGFSCFKVYWRKEGNVLFSNTLNTFYLRLYVIRHMVKDHSDSESGNLLLPHGLLFPISSKGSFICIILKFIEEQKENAYVFYIWIYIVCMSGFDLIHTYSSDALAQGILKSFFAFTNFLMPLPRSEPVAPNHPRLSGKHDMHSPNSLTIKKRLVC